MTYWLWYTYLLTFFLLSIS